MATLLCRRPSTVDRRLHDIPSQILRGAGATEMKMNYAQVQVMYICCRVIIESKAKPTRAADERASMPRVIKNGTTDKKSPRSSNELEVPFVRCKH